MSLPYNQIIGVASADEGVIFQTSEITLITAAGNYTLRWDLTAAGDGWFAAHGATPLEMPLRVQPAGTEVRARPAYAGERW